MTDPTVDAPRFAVSWGGASDRGLRRDHNEDAFLTAPPVFLVADGMGGHQRGDAASRAVVDAFEELVNDPWLTSERLHDAVVAATEAVRQIAVEGMGAPGTTLAGVGIAVQEGRPCWLVFNVGDSRAYRLSRGTLEQVSVDHSEVQELVETGALDATEARIHSHRNVITRAIGAGLRGEPEIDQWLLLAADGDRMLICTDGLTTELTDQLLAATLLTIADPKQAARDLVDAAVAAGGRDNVTAVVVDAVSVVSTGHGAQGAADEGDTLVEGLTLAPDDGDTVPTIEDSLAIDIPGPRSTVTESPNVSAADAQEGTP
ncbi:MAG: serine/threonine-protein phosphatase [Actinomycetales bacterium]|nr:serine/threonine-protein phosphatase [Actinomycetales bacterium]